MSTRITLSSPGGLAKGLRWSAVGDWRSQRATFGFAVLKTAEARVGDGGGGLPFPEVTVAA